MLFNTLFSFITLPSSFLLFLFLPPPLDFFLFLFPFFLVSISTPFRLHCSFLLFFLCFISFLISFSNFALLPLFSSNFALSFLFPYLSSPFNHFSHSPFLLLLLSPLYYSLAFAHFLSPLAFLSLTFFHPLFFSFSPAYIFYFFLFPSSFSSFPTLFLDSVCNSPITCLLARLDNFLLFLTIYV